MFSQEYDDYIDEINSKKDATFNITYLTASWMPQFI